ncbi:MAG: aspartate aminotransferase family protein [Proteobacteria bacterium]|nr:aspartate aminotransferase family protein [Pseudomonadota bacterium]
MSSEEIKSKAARVVMNTYGRYDLALAGGRGALVYDPEGREYLDFVAGLAVASLGHAHEGVAVAVARQARTLVHVSNLYFTEPMVRVAERLVDNSFADRVFFCNSGGEANEAAIKLARKYSHDRYGAGRYRILSMEHSFHGRTMATLSATAQTKIHKGFEPLVDGFGYLPWGDPEALDRAMTEDVCAVMIEPIQGEGGVNEPPAGFLERAAESCRSRDILLIFDEVQVGLGRTGELFAYENFGVEPDIMTLAKALANGLPMGACLARETVAEHFGPGTHATTFGGTPLVSAAALVVLDVMLAPGFLDQVRRVGAYFKTLLQKLAGRHDFIRQVRGRGLILALQLDFPGGGAVKALMDRGFLVNCTQDTVLRFLPPLIITEAEVDRLMPVLEEVLVAEAEALED